MEKAMASSGLTEVADRIPDKGIIEYLRKTKSFKRTKQTVCIERGQRQKQTPVAQI